ncbi:unnamed protein product, partial [Allacma fusca]
MNNQLRIWQSIEFSSNGE